MQATQHMSSLADVEAALTYSTAQQPVISPRTTGRQNQVGGSKVSTPRAGAAAFHSVFRNAVTNAQRQLVDPQVRGSPERRTAVRKEGRVVIASALAAPDERGAGESIVTQLSLGLPRALGKTRTCFQCGGKVTKPDHSLLSAEEVQLHNEVRQFAMSVRQQ